MLLPRSFFFVTTALLASAPVVAGDVTTVAGGGTLTGDGVAATSARLQDPVGLDVAADGTIYFAENSRFRVRRVTTDGVITTIAGTGVGGDGGDGGPATSALLSGLLSVALDEANNRLYIGDIDNSRVRVVDLSTSIITTFAGTGTPGISGDGGPATSAELFFPQGVAVDAAGDVYIADTGACIVRKVSGGVITTFSGQLFFCVPGIGDGGPAAGAAFGQPQRIATDAAGNVYITDGANATVRRVDSGGTISTVAGGGGGAVVDGASATAVNLGDVNDVTVGNGGELLIATFAQAVSMDSAGALTVVAGTGAAGFSGDGGPATSATFNDVQGIAMTPSGAVLLSDRLNARIRSVAPDAPPPPPLIDLIIELLTDQGFLDSIFNVPGNVIMVNIDGRDTLIVPNVTAVGGGVTVVDNDQLITIDLSDLQSVGGGIVIEDNAALTTIDLSSLEAVDGGISIVNDPNLTTLLVNGITSVGGGISIVGTDLTTIDLSSIQSVDGGVTIADNTSATTIDLGAMETVQDITITGNTSATSIDLGSVTAVDGGVTIADNGSATVDVSAIETVNGGVVVESTGTGTFDVDFCASGSTDINATGYASVTAMTADQGTTTVTLEDESVVSVSLGDAAFDGCVAFTVTRVPVAPEEGTDASGAPATIDPVDAYEFEFDVPDLGAPATLTFDIILANLDPARQVEVLDAVAAGELTMVTKSGDAGSTYESFAICEAGQTPETDGCVVLETLGADGLPTTDIPFVIRFSNVVSHFSIWGIAIVSTIVEQQECPAPSEDLCADTSGFGTTFAATYERTTGRPVAVTSTFDAAPGGAILVVHNNGCSSAVATLNGADVFLPNDFNQTVTCFTRAVSLEASNEFVVAVRSSPGCSIDVSFQQLEACVGDGGGGGGDPASCAASQASTPAILALCALGFAFRRRRR